MQNELSTGAIEVSNATKPRKPYHTPRIENYGAVNELTRSGPPGNPFSPDGTTLYSTSAG